MAKVSWWVVPLATALFGCSKDVKRGTPEGFSAPLGSLVEPVCTKENNDQSFTLDGWFGLPNELEIDEKNQTSVDFYFDAPGSGRSVVVAAKYPTQVQLQAGPEKVAAGFRRTKANADAESFRVSTKSGPATAREKVRATVRVETSEDFTTHAVLACAYHLVGAEKL